MKNLIVLFLFFHSAIFAGDIQLNDVRLLFQKAATDKAACKKLIADLNQYNETDSTTFAAYKACATMMMANHCFNPFSKLSYFNDGRFLLEKCITHQSENIEVRYLRFTIQSSSPDFLGYNKSIHMDKNFLLNHYSTIKDQQLKNMIGSFLLSSEHLTTAEKQNLKS
jgi:hypothetical protein